MTLVARLMTGLIILAGVENKKSPGYWPPFSSGTRPISSVPGTCTRKQGMSMCMVCTVSMHISKLGRYRSWYIVAPALIYPCKCTCTCTCTSEHAHKQGTCTYRSWYMYSGTCAHEQGTSTYMYMVCTLNIAHKQLRYVHGTCVCVCVCVRSVHNLPTISSIPTNSFVFL